MSSCKSMAEAFTIFAKYTEDRWATNAEHDILCVNVNGVNDADSARLKDLGWHRGHDEDPDEGWSIFT
jgi:hypothetical protein